MPEAKVFDELDSKAIRILQVTPSQREGSVLAYASVEFGYWIVRGIRLMRRSDGVIWLGMPGQKGQDGEWRDTCFVPARAARDRLLRAIEEAYQAMSQPGDPAMAGGEGDVSR
jgi:DNA-binding cell septation regulator SpoVG